VDLIVSNPHQPRAYFEAESLEALAESIREHGIIQPLLVTRVETKGEGPAVYQLIAGERRLQAARMAGLSRVPVVVKEATSSEALELALVENLQRADLNPLEEAQAFRRLADEFGLTQEAIAARVGRSRTAVANALRLLALDDDLKASLVRGEMSEGHARALLVEMVRLVSEVTALPLSLDSADPAALEFLADMSDGDARKALTALEIGVLSQAAQAGAGPLKFHLETARESIQQKAVLYDGTGDTHYDLASALQKSMRGSDPDATVYWLARMLAGGEDTRFIARRIAICATEDVGNADPMATVLAAAAVQVAEFVGLPEARFRLLHAAVSELNDLAAAQTAQVAVVLMSVNVLVVHVSVLEKDFLHQAAFHQQGQGAVYRSPGDAQAFMTQAQNKLFHIKVVMIGKNLSQDCLSFRRGSHALLGQKFLEDFPFGFHVIAIETLSQ